MGKDRIWHVWVMLESHNFVSVKGKLYELPDKLKAAYEDTYCWDDGNIKHKGHECIAGWGKLALYMLNGGNPPFELYTGLHKYADIDRLFDRSSLRLEFKKAVVRLKGQIAKAEHEIDEAENNMSICKEAINLLITM